MKVLCVNNEYVRLCITVGKWYEVKELDGDWNRISAYNYHIKDDKERWSVLDRKYFRTIEEIREEKLKELGV